MQYQALFVLSRLIELLQIDMDAIIFEIVAASPGRMVERMKQAFAHDLPYLYSPLIEIVGLQFSLVPLKRIFKIPTVL